MRRISRGTAQGRIGKKAQVRRKSIHTSGIHTLNTGIVRVAQTLVTDEVACAVPTFVDLVACSTNSKIRSSCNRNESG